MKPTLVLGLGSRLMMDDGVGVAVVEHLAGEEWKPGVHFEIGETDFDHCLGLAEGCDALIVVDAAVTGQRPGDVSVLPLRQLACCRPVLSVHEQHFLDLLLRLQVVDSGVLVGIEPFRIAFHYGLSAELEAQWGKIIDSVRVAVSAQLGQPANPEARG